MARFLRVASLLFLYGAFFHSSHAWARVTPNIAFSWSSAKVQHAYGLPDIKPRQHGRLMVDADHVIFTGKSSGYVISRRSIVAVSAGYHRVELWGLAGRLLRLALPDGSSIAAAALLHHKVGMLTIEFRDVSGAYHGAVFFLAADDAARALQSFSTMSEVNQDPTSSVCKGSPMGLGSVLVAAPSWDEIQVPAAYRALVYEHLIDRLQRTKGIGPVFRDGEYLHQRGCPRYTIQTSIAGFKEGSQVKRAIMGPAGYFVGTTQMKFDTIITDVSGTLNNKEQIKATVRGENDSLDVADSIAKKIVKHYHRAELDFEKTLLRSSSSPQPQR